MIAKVKFNPNGEKLRQLIAERGVSLKEFAKQVPVSYAYLSLIVNNKTSITPQMAKKICDKLGIDMKDIFLLNVFTNS